MLLRCLVNKPVVQCEWSWRASNSSQAPLLVKKFNPNKDADHDCSVRFKNVLYEEEGLWTCGVRLSPHGILHEAPPATVSLLPTGMNTTWFSVKYKKSSPRNIYNFSQTNIVRKLTNAKINKQCTNFFARLSTIT